MKNKTIEILDALHHKELIGDKFKVRDIIKSENIHKKKMNTVKKSNPLKMPGWFLAWSSSFEARTNARFDKIETEMREGFKQVNTRIDNLVKKNNLKE